MKKRLALCLLLVACAPKRVEDEDQKRLAEEPAAKPAETTTQPSAATDTSFVNFVMQMQTSLTSAKNTCDAVNTREIPLREERALGNLRAIDFITNNGPLSTKAEATKELSRIGLSIARASARPSLPWTFGIIENTEAKSFSSAGGYVFVTTGLIKKCANEAQLAGVLAREISHVVQLIDLSSYRTSMQLICISSMAMKVEGYSPNADITDAAFAEANWKNIGPNFNSLKNESREAEADGFSIAMLRTAGYEPAEYEKMLSDAQRIASFKSKRGNGPTNGKKPPLPAALRF